MSNGSVALETLLVFGLRAGFFLLASRYLKQALFADLRQVIHDETSLNTGGTSDTNGIRLSGGSSGLNSGHESPDEFDTSAAASPIGNGQSLKNQLYSLRAGNISSTSILPTSSNPNSPSGRLATSSSSLPDRTTRKTSTKKGGAAGAPKLAGTVFCLSVSECSTLFALILFGGAISEKARLLNWNLSLGAVLSVIVIVVPLGMCLLMAMRQRATSKSFRRTATFTAIPFFGYLFCLYELGQYIATLFGVEQGSHTFGLFSTTLDRICVPGVALIAALSGGGAVITAWNAFEWRERFKAEAVTEGHINAAARSLAQTRTDLAARQAEVDALSSAAHDDGNNNKGFFSMFSSSPNAAKIKSLQAEIKGLEVMESQMSHDLQLMKRRKEIGELSKTWSGKALKALGWAFSIYCMYRVAMSLLNLIFGGALSSGSGRSNPSDVTSAILSRVAEALGLEIDVHTWTKAIGLVLTGSIILVNINAVLGYVSRAFRATSAGVSASFMLLFLSQLMAVYLLTSLISLPHPDATDAESSSSAILLDTLPDFRVFSRLFDAVFLLAASTCFILRYLQRKIRVDEHLGLQDFV